MIKNTFQSVYEAYYRKSILYVKSYVPVNILADVERPLKSYGGHSDCYVFSLAENYLPRAEAYY